MSVVSDVRYFRLVSGVHSHAGKTYLAKDIVPCGVDLCAKFNRPESLRFVELAADDVPAASRVVTSAPDDVESEPESDSKYSTLSLKQLKKLASENGIAIPDNATKALLIERLQFALD